ncbi:histidine triad nucleotide binding protein [Mycobacterium phage Optimus]|uniref:Histidine triad nucleotide binding protein n=3 Tax=Omegavirus TaxID=1623292 RepID=A0A3S9UB62_9CAUD|nr:histidine triad nucleotide binding protein [Mycobacterium phage Redno2]YP_009046982.1 histidine triad nucleotide binding protein [Mycobacterium phage Wanda]YP_009124139.1 histidine triad nucleotide binding protein [Mycobacterium phage Minerva]YP_009591040.1 nucleotide hydrolase or transferase [Mycobacterium phage Optimus]YP_009636363.1 HIT domain protein [Mycobacterium phage Baka]AXQ52413.1 histidine triad nucleotide binding protein [Mycobacterium phage EricMillard]AZS07524.1 histidine tri
MTAGCVFCPDNWPNLDIVKYTGTGAIVVPLNPVVDGHVLVIHRAHSADAAADPMIAADLMCAAALWIHYRDIQANIITSIGPAATQTVFHTHVHIVPRAEGDGLPLPWTPQQLRTFKG